MKAAVHVRRDEAIARAIEDRLNDRVQSNLDAEMAIALPDIADGYVCTSLALVDIADCYVYHIDRDAGHS